MEAEAADICHKTARVVEEGWTKMMVKRMTREWNTVMENRKRSHQGLGLVIEYFH
jgi:hypothetical protein